MPVGLLFFIFLYLQVLNFGETVKKNPLPLSRLESVIKPYKISDVGYQNLHGYMANLMSLATLSVSITWQ